MHVLPLEMVNHIWNFCNIDTKLALNRAFGARTFYTTQRSNVKVERTFARQLDRFLRISYFRYIVLKQMCLLNSS